MRLTQIEERGIILSMREQELTSSKAEDPVWRGWVREITMMAVNGLILEPIDFARQLRRDHRGIEGLAVSTLPVLIPVAGSLGMYVASGSGVLPAAALGVGLWLGESMSLSLLEINHLLSIVEIQRQDYSDL